MLFERNFLTYGPQISDVMAVFGIVAMSLDTGEAIHEVLPRSLLDRVYYHHSLGPHDMSGPSRGDGDDDTMHAVGLTTDKRYASLQFAIYATGCSAAFQILHSLDELHRIVKELCGEIPLKGFEHWRREFEMKQLQDRA